MKKILFTVSISIFCSSSYAQSAFEGFYGQIGLGYQFLDDKATNSSFRSNENSTNYALSVTDANPQGFAGNIAVGFNKSITENFLLGLGAEFSPVATNQDSRTITSSAGNTFQGWLKLNNYYNIFITPSYAIEKDKLVYLKAGWSQANISNPYNTYNQSGLSLGLGYKQFFSGNWYGFAEVNYIMYGNTSYSLQVPASEIRGSGTSTATNSGNLLSGLVGIGYKF